VIDDGIDGICELVLEAEELEPMVEFYERDYFREGEGAESGIKGLVEPTCPSCGASPGAPADRSESLEVGGKWILDEAAEGRRRMAEGPGDVESPATT
jgi:hypothetical protein